MRFSAGCGKSGIFFADGTKLDEKKCVCVRACVQHFFFLSSSVSVNTACECVSEEEKGQPQQKARRRANSGRSRANFPVGPLAFPERSKKYPVTFVRGQSARGARGQNVPADSQKKKNLDDDQQQQQSVGATRGKQRTRRSHPLVVCARECE